MVQHARTGGRALGLLDGCDLEGSQFEGAH